MRSIVGLLLLAVIPFSASVLPQSQEQSAGSGDAPVFRDPFTLKLKIDKGHFYEEHFDKVPYVAEGSVYLFTGEQFGISVSFADDEVSQVRFQRDIRKANMVFKLSEDLHNGRAMTILVVRNNLDRRMLVDALMAVPEKKGIYKTSVLPVLPRTSNFESWPHPIVQLVLRNFRVVASNRK